MLAYLSRRDRLFVYTAAALLALNTFLSGLTIILLAAP